MSSSEVAESEADRPSAAPVAAVVSVRDWGAPGRTWSVAVPTEVEERIRHHLVRVDGQEDICFALYRPSTGASRDTALVFEVVLPEEGERGLHGNAEFSSDYFLRAACLAATKDAGLVLLHSHPGASTWQGLSDDDWVAEQGHALATEVLTGRPLAGMTLAGRSGTYSARFWPDRAGAIQPEWAKTVRVVGARIQVSFNPMLAPEPPPNPRLIRTTHAWGSAVQNDLARITVGIIGAGSVAELVGEALVRTGIAHVDVLDFDLVEQLNLDRLLYATDDDIGIAKAELLAHWLRRHAVAEKAHITFECLSLVEPEGWARALDCDVLFSCVDRPWPRFAANIAAYGHLIPVVDGGISVDVDDLGCRGAEWRAHLCAPGRPCLECIGQYDPADVALERVGKLDDPHYINSLPADHRLRTRENVFAFSMACGAAEVLELLRAIVGPAGQFSVGGTTVHWGTGMLDLDTSDCHPGCPFATELLALGDGITLNVTGNHPAAQVARAAFRPPGAISPTTPWWRWVLALVRSLGDVVRPTRKSGRGRSWPSHRRVSAAERRTSGG